MKLSSRDAARYCAKPDPRHCGILIYGEDAMRVALKRQQAIAALVGPNADEEMRLTRLAASELRSDPAVLADATKARGFFPGHRVVFVEDATDAVAAAITSAIDQWEPDDAQIVVTGKQLAPRSSLRKLFEGRNNTVAIGIYDDPPTREEIEATLHEAGVAADGKALQELLFLATTLDPGDFRQTVEKIALYKLNDAAPLTTDDVAACAPASTEAATDDLLTLVADGRLGEIGPLLQRLRAQGTQPVSLCIAATRYFRALHASAANPAGPTAALQRMRPPVPFKLRDKMARQAQRWGIYKLETALGVLIDSDLALRSSQKAPDFALIERSLIRLAMLGQRQ